MSDTEPKPNLPLLRAVLAQIDAAPERWEQASYAVKKDCGTAYCVAGWAVHISHPDAEPRFGTECDCYECSGDRLTATGMQMPDGRFVDIENEAVRLLGITYGEGQCLFDADNSRETVQHHAEQIAARAGESL